MEPHEIEYVISMATPYDIASIITFENSHLVAQALALEAPEVAKAFYAELDYWKQTGRI